jgi:hypothetical protein
VSEVERVQPIDGARVVTFDYDAAEDALAAVQHTMPEILGGQVAPRTTAGENATDEWSGHFRDEFDRAEASLLARITDGAAWGSTGPAGEIYAAVGRANDRQQEYNEARTAALEAEREREEQEQEDSVPTGPGPS